MIRSDKHDGIHYSYPSVNVVNGCVGVIFGIPFICVGFISLSSENNIAWCISASFLPAGVLVLFAGIFSIAKRKKIGVELTQTELMHYEMFGTTRILYSSIKKIDQDPDNLVIQIESSDGMRKNHEIAI